MDVHTSVPLLDAVLESHRGALGGDFVPYRNHCLRVYNFCLALAPSGIETDKVAIAAAFHDIGIWTKGTFDYLAPSEELAHAYLARTGRERWSAEIEAMIRYHHKLTRYRKRPEWLVEPFRKADWIDMTLGRRSFGLPASFIAQVRAAIPNAGFHRKVGTLIKQRLRTHPFNPLPMFRL